MLEVVKYDVGRFEEWNAFNRSAKNGLFMFDRNYMDYHSDRFEDFSLMIHDEEGELIALMPASKHGDQLRSHGGLTFGGLVFTTSSKQHTINEIFDALVSFAKESGFASIVYKAVPYVFTSYPAQEDLYALWKHHAVLVRRDVASVIDLRAPAKMPKGRKAQISRARREGVVVEDSTDYVSFMDLENTVLMNRHGAHAVHTAEELTLLASRFPENIRLVVAKRQGQLLAGGVLYVYADLAHTQYLANSDEGCEIGALDLLISEQIKLYSSQKTFFDLGTSMADSASGLNDGLIAQKEGFGGRAVMYDTYEMKI